jgi:hypothetical protein
MNMSLCVRVSGSWRVQLGVSVSASLYADRCAHVLLWVCAFPGAASLPAAGPARSSPRAPLTAVFYHHLLRKGAQEDGDK